jgi:hypothetical protein
MFDSSVNWLVCSMDCWYVTDIWIVDYTNAKHEYVIIICEGGVAD